MLLLRQLAARSNIGALLLLKLLLLTLLLLTLLLMLLSLDLTPAVAVRLLCHGRPPAHNWFNVARNAVRVRPPTGERARKNSPRA